MIADYLIYAAVGRLLIFLLQRFPPAGWLAKRLNLTKLYECDLCLGLWVYWFLAFPLKIEIIDSIDIVIFDQFVTGAVTTTLVWLIRTGWQDQFGDIVVQ